MEGADGPGRVVAAQRYQVIVVGGGPVGTGLAVDLGLRGISCALIERYERPQRIPKGQNLTQRTMEHFRAWGIEDDIRAARVMPPDYPTGGVTAYGNLIGRYAYPWWQRHEVEPYYFTGNERLPQYRTESVLRARVTALTGIDPFFGWSGGWVEQDETGVRVGIAPRRGGTELILEADYVVGCDGSRSTVREAAGIEEERSEHDKLMVLVVFRSRQLHELVERFGPASFFKVLHPSLDGYWQFLGRVDVGEEWFFHAPAPRGTKRETFDATALLQRAIGTEVSVEFDYVGFWDLRVATASSYQRGRVFIGGDAAHSHPPYGGYGVNTGLEDARNLAWKLAARLDGWGGEELLASYTEERRPVFVSTARDFIETFIEEDREFLDRHDPDRDPDGFDAAWEAHAVGAAAGVHAFEPHYEGSSIVFGPRDASSSARGSHEFLARPGHHLAPQPLTTGASLFEELGTGFALLAFDANDEAVMAFERAARAMRIPLDVIRDTYAGGREAYGSPMVLVRPDLFVCWTGDGSSVDTRRVLGRAVGRPRDV